MRLSLGRLFLFSKRAILFNISDSVTLIFIFFASCEYNFSFIRVWITWTDKLFLVLGLFGRLEVSIIKSRRFIKSAKVIASSLTIATMLIMSTSSLSFWEKTVDNIREVASLLADISFIGDPQEKIEPNYRIYNGIVKNEGLNRANFVRVIFKLWGSETDLIASDSAFVDGSETIYQSGIISDTAIMPGESAEYEVRVFVPRDDRIQYITRDAHWEIYE